MCNPSDINPVWVAVTLLSMEPVTSHSGFQALPLLLIKSYSQVFRMVKIYIHTSVSRLHSLLDIFFFYKTEKNTYNEINRFVQFGNFHAPIKN